MEENTTRKVENIDIVKHYLASILIYGIMLGIIEFLPVYTEAANEGAVDYLGFFSIYYLLYVILAPIIFFIARPKTILRSRSVAVIKYFKRQFSKKSTEEYLKNIAPTEIEAQAFMSFFVKGFFGAATVILLCTKYLPSFSYNIDFLNVMFGQAVQYITDPSSIQGGIIQYILDTGDMWIKLMFTVTTSVLAFSYLTELNIFKNRIKYSDTTPLGIFICAICYYPIVILTDKFINITDNPMLPVNNQIVLVILTILAMIVNFISMIAILRLGTKSGNLTNRGIVTGFPYNIVRHPDYAAQIGYIIVTTIPFYLMSDLTLGDKMYVTFYTAVWILIYIIRAITEERNLIKDEKYKQYVKKVKYRFIPKLF